VIFMTALQFCVVSYVPVCLALHKAKQYISKSVQISASTG